LVNQAAQTAAKTAHLRKRKKFLSKRELYWLAHPGSEADAELERVVVEQPDHRHNPMWKDNIRAFAARECGVAYVEVADRLYDFDTKIPRPRDAVHDDGTPGGRSKYTPRLVQESVEYVKFRAAKDAPDIDLATATNDQIGQFVDHLMTMAVMAVCEGVKR
jgi:hypothetical protein